jgi:hypothetical protein
LARGGDVPGRLSPSLDRTTAASAARGSGGEEVGGATPVLTMDDDPVEGTDVRHPGADHRGVELSGIGCRPSDERMIMTTAPRHQTDRLRTNPLRKLVHAAVVTVLALGGIVAIADTASAATPVARLSIRAPYCATVTGYIPMGEYETHGYLNNGARMNIELYGDDWGLYDDFLGSTGWITKAMGTVNGATLYPSARGIEFEWVTCGPPGSSNFWLNEDLYTSDEVYASVTIFDGDGGLLLERQSNTVSGDYSF